MLFPSISKAGQGEHLPVFRSQNGPGQSPTQGPSKCLHRVPLIWVGSSATRESMYRLLTCQPEQWVPQEVAALQPLVYLLSSVILPGNKWPSEEPLVNIQLCSVGSSLELHSSGYSSVASTTASSSLAILLIARSLPHPLSHFLLSCWAPDDATQESPKIWAQHGRILGFAQERI